MTRQQLRLIETFPTSRLDEQTKTVGRAGLERARAALAEADKRRAARDAFGHPPHPTAA